MASAERESKADRLSVQGEGRNVLVVRPEEPPEGQIRVKVRIDAQGRIVIPAFVRNELKIAPNDTFWLVADAKGIALKKIDSKELAPVRTSG